MVTDNIYADNYESQFEIITSKTKISAILGQFKNLPSTLAIIPCDTNTPYKGMLLDIAPDRKIITLALHNNSSIHSILSKKHEAKISITFVGTEASFSAVFIEALKSRQEFHFAFPKQLKYFQRRAEHRVHLNTNTVATVAFIDAEGKPHSGQVKDLSATGMSIQLEETDLPDLSATPTIAACTIKLPDNPEISCQLNVRYTKIKSHVGRCTLGVSFSDLGHGHLRLIERFIAGVERKALRQANTRR